MVSGVCLESIEIQGFLSYRPKGIKARSKKPFAGQKGESSKNQRYYRPDEIQKAMDTIIILSQSVILCQ